MPTIPSGTKFMGVNPDVNTDERRSSLSNSYQEFYTIDDIVAEASAADTNIYNSDGTLDGNRAVTMAGNTLNFSGGTIGLNTVPTQLLDVNGVTRHRDNVLMDPGTTLLWEDSTGVLPTSVNSKIRWRLNSDSAEIYAFSPAVTTDDIDFVFKMSDNATSSLDNYVFWMDDFAGEATDRYPLEMNGLDFIVNPLRRYATLPANQAAGATNFNVLKLGATNLTNTILHANVTTERVGINTSSPSETLEINGKTKTTTFQMTTTPTAGYVLTSDASGNGTWLAAAGGLTEFTELETTAAPNATVPVNSLTPVTATTNADVAIVPKGTGALLANIPDNTSTGGNKRGTYAVDWQIIRNAAARVASGAYSAIIGGYYNTSSGTASVAGGFENQVAGDSSVGLGASNTTSTSNCFVLGNSSTASGGFGAVALGRSNTASGDGTLTAGAFNTASGSRSVSLGESNTASAANAVALGFTNTANAANSLALGSQSNTFSVIGRQVYASGLEATSGDSQSSKFILRERTTNATATTITTNSSAASTNNQVILSNQSAFRFKGSIVGKQSGSVNSVAWDIDGFIVRGANAAATTLNVSNVTLVQNTPAWGTPTLAADTTNGGLRVQVIGAAATNIQWTATIETTEVIYA